MKRCACPAVLAVTVGFLIGGWRRGNLRLADPRREWKDVYLGPECGRPD